jgi:MOSC domain-containing protein YiiM
MQNTDIVNGLLQLGFQSGWVVTGDEITLWENSQPMPTMSALITAATQWGATQKAEAEAKATQKAALLERLGITQEEANLLLG